MNSAQLRTDATKANQKSTTLFEKGRKAMKARVFFAAWLTAAFCLSSLSHAEVPQMINYQGTLTDTTGSPITGDYDMTFSIYDAPTEGTQLWTESQNAVPVEEGIFNVLLSIPASVFDGSTRYLGVTVGSDDEMTPRRPVVSVGYAFRSEFADTAEYAQTGAPDDDWVVRGDTVYHDGNVGIGTTTPAEKLDVEGNIHASGSIFSGNSIGIETGDAFGPDRLVTDGPIIYVDQEFPWGPNTFTGDIKVGIGDDDPDAFLEVSANAGVAPGRALFMLSSDDAADGDLVVVEDDGDVGIGTPSPSEKLDVGGNIHASGSIISGSSITLDGSNDKITASSGKIDFDDEDLVTTGNLGIGIVAPSDKLHVDNGNIKISGAGNGIYFPDGSFQTSSGVGSANSVSNNLDAVISGDSDANGSGGVILRTGSDNRVTVLNNGNVGIGTTSPSAKLTVLGPSGATTDRLFQLLKDGGYGGTAFYQYYVTSQDFGLIVGQDNTDYTMRMNVDPGNQSTDFKGNVGIGTTNPGTAKLAVMDGNVGIGTTDPKGTLDINGLIVGGGTSGIKIDSEGNVGIGTTSPTYKLQVTSSTNNIAVHGLATCDDWNYGVYGGAGGDGSTTNYGVMGRAAGGTTDNRGGYFEGDDYGVYGKALKEPGYGGYFEGRGYFSGNVGIGTAPSTDKLAVRFPNTGGNIRLDRSSSYQWFLGIEEDSGFYISKEDVTNANKVLFLSTGGRVGIGTTEPILPLHVLSADDAVARFESSDGRTGIELRDPLGTAYIYSSQGTIEVDASRFGIGITPQRTLHIKDVLRLEPRATAPQGGGLGDLYVKTDGKLYFHDGSGWKAVQLSP
jgi:hypothetical protein